MGRAGLRLSVFRGAASGALSPPASARRLSTACLCALALAYAGATTAQNGHNQYKWRDGGGALHYSDALPPDALQYGYEIVNAQGLVIKRVERAKTSEEKAAAKAELAKAQALREESDTRIRVDSQLLAAYPNESDLKRAQQQKLELLDQQVGAASISLRSQEQALADQLAHAAEVERNGKTLPDAQAKQLVETQKQVDAQRAALARRDAEHAAAVTKFEAEAARYRELKAKLAQSGR